MTLVHFGFDRGRRHLFVRLDGERRLADLLADGYEFSLKFLQQPAEVRFTVQLAFGRLVGQFWDRPAGSSFWVVRDAGRCRVAAGKILEVEVSLAELGVSAGTVSFLVLVFGRWRRPLESQPEHRPIEVTVADVRLEARNWTAWRV